MKKLLLLVCLLFHAAAIAQGIWSPILSEGLSQRCNHASAVIDGKIYLIGGQSAFINIPVEEQTYFTTIETYDPTTGIWSVKNPSGFTPRIKPGACVYDGKIYVFGGSVFDTTLNWYRRLDILEVYDPVANTWQTHPSSGLFIGRGSVEAHLINEKIYLVGGITSGGNTKLMEIFDPLTGNVTIPEPEGTFTPRAAFTSSVVDNKIYVVGGITYISDSASFTNLTALEVYDPATNKWSAPLTTGSFRSRHGLASSVIDKKIYVIGGATDSVLYAFEIFDPHSNIWTTPATTGIFTPRSELTANTVNNKIYTMGGILTGGLDSLAINEMFTPGSREVATLNVTDLSVIPNPTSGVVTIANIPFQTENITVTNVLGDVVRKQSLTGASSFSLDLTNLSSGTYYVTLFSPTGTIVKKIILH